MLTFLSKVFKSNLAGNFSAYMWFIIVMFSGQCFYNSL